MRDMAQRVAKRFIAEFQRDDVAGLAAELAYRLLFAIFPFGIFVAALTAFVATAVGIDDPTGKIIGAVGDNLPRDLAAGIRPQLEAVIGTQRPGLLTLGAVAALWAATGGMNALIKAMNRAWEVEETRPLIPRYAVAIGLTVLASVGLIGSFVSIVGVSLLSREVITRLGLDATAVDIVGLLRWPAVFALLSLAVAILYRYAPNFRAPWRWCLAGGALFAVAWLVATGLFALYVANFANYANTYGALGGVIVLMLWLYLSGMVVIAAAALVAAALKELHPTVVQEKRVERGVASEGVAPAPTPSSGGAWSPTRVPTALSPRAFEPTAVSGGPAVAAARPRRAGAAPPYRMSGPEDWALAGAVTAVGLTLGALAAWALGPNRRD
jgi:membrane protein